MAVADVTQTTAASQPLLLDWSGVNYWWGSGAAGNYCTTPDNVANEITGDIELKACINIGTIVGSEGLTPVICKYNSYYMILYSNYEIKFYNGTTVSAATTRIPTNTTFTKITRSASTGDINFYTSIESITTNINSVTWTKLGNTVSSTAGNLPTSSGSVYVGSAGNAWPCLGKIYRATISDTIGGAPVVDFNPSEYSASSSQTDWNSSTGEGWTINTGTAATGYKGVLVDRTLMQGDGVDDYVITSGIINAGASYDLNSGFKGFNLTNGTQPFGAQLSTGTNSQNYLFQTAGSGTSYWYYSNGSSYRYGLVTYADTSLSVLNQRYFNGDGFATAKKNNTTDLSNLSVVGTATTSVGTAMFALFRAGESNSRYYNGIVNNFSLSAYCDSTQRTALYNVIKTMNKL